ncbi:hypothetical protein Fmac_016770 [Flemingia macrophylla]|uniref:Transposase n=1 Tax=Flemingia macrophylla TaxID=520843 RepID=A0ABD1MID9_9FABA
MDTPSSSPPGNSPTRQAKSRKTRGPTQMRGLARRFKTGKRIPLNVDPILGRVSGPNKVSFSSYLGTLARDKISILVPSWDKVPASTKNMIWQDILEYFDIANTPIIRNKILSSVAVKFRQHKSYLTREWIYGKYKGKCPCEKYNIDLQEWEKFKESRSDPSWEPIRKKAQTIQKLNDAPHVLSRGGYDRLVDNIMASELKRQKEGATQAGAGEDVAINPLHPPPRHKLWKMARTKQSGRMTSELASQIGEKIDLLEKQAAQGSFVPQGRHDILNAALGGQSTLVVFEELGLVLLLGSTLDPVHMIPPLSD